MVARRRSNGLSAEERPTRSTTGSAPEHEPRTFGARFVSCRCARWRASVGERILGAVSRLASTAHRAWARALAVLVATLALSPALAFAEPIVIVYVRRAGRPVDGTVTLTDDAGRTTTCQTQHGQCRVDGLHPGRHLVVAQANDGRRAESRPVLLPSDGKVSLFVAIP